MLVATPQYTPWAHKAHGGPKYRYVSGVKPRRYLGLFMVKRTHVESLILLPRGYDPRYCLPTALLHSVVGLGVGGLEGRWLPTGLAGGSKHPLGRTPRPPQAGAPGSLKTMAPHWPYRRLRTPPGQDSPSPPGRCARFSEDDGPPLALQEAPNTPWAGLPVPPRSVRPVL